MKDAGESFQNFQYIHNTSNRQFSSLGYAVGVYAHTHTHTFITRTLFKKRKLFWIQIVWQSTNKRKREWRKRIQNSALLFMYTHQKSTFPFRNLKKSEIRHFYWKKKWNSKYSKSMGSDIKAKKEAEVFNDITCMWASILFIPFAFSLAYSSFMRIFFFK